jgi:hypothetical protein
MQDETGAVILQTGLRRDEGGLVTDDNGQFQGFVEGFRGECASHLARFLSPPETPEQAPLLDPAFLVLEFDGLPDGIRISVTEDMIKRTPGSQGGVFDELNLATILVLCAH